MNEADKQKRIKQLEELIKKEQEEVNKLKKEMFKEQEEKNKELLNSIGKGYKKFYKK